ncbi:hypothetical protein MD484_g6148, partial [Candolleomyces efflorescens]
MTRLLTHFILNLKPQTRNLSTDQISTTVAGVFAEFLKTPGRTVFWDDELNANVDPFLKILRQLVEFQLEHAPAIKTIIDRAWGVVHNKHKKREITPPPDSSDPKSRDNLQLLPIGQDISRKRYWAVDESPRVYVSTNPWKITATFQTVSSSKEEYLALVEQLKAEVPTGSPQKRNKMEQNQLNLVKSLEDRVEVIDAELARVARIRKKIEQRQALYAQAELRETRTRRRTQKPDYVYSNGYGESEDEGDEYKFQEEEEDFSSGSRKRKPVAAPTRRSGRTVARNKSRDASPADSLLNWRGERRSARLGAPPDMQLDSEPAFKRARTEDSVASGTSLDGSTTGANGTSNGVKVKKTGAAALKPTEVAMEQIAGKKRSKFWVYAVEPLPGTEPMDTDALTNEADPELNPQEHGSKSETDGASGTSPDDSLTDSPTGSGNKSVSYDRSMRGSLSPLPMDIA